MKIKKNKSILLVEDEVIIAIIEKKQLEKFGYSIHHVINGEDAVKTSLDAGSDYDIILMDIDLGFGIDGTQAAEQILKKKDIPIVFLSSHTEPEIVEKTEKITSYGYVVKNSGFVVLDASIKMALKLFEEKMERKRAEEAVLLSEENYRFQFMNMNSYNSLYEVVTDKDGRPYDFRFIMVNYAYEEYVGKKASELIGKTLLEVYPETEQYWIDKMTEAVLTGVPIHFENYSQEMNTLIEINLYIPKKGQLAMTSANINERKRAEDALRESELTFRKLFEDSADAILLIDKTGVFVECNQAALILLKMTREQFLFKTSVDISPEYQADGQRSREKVLKMVEIAYEKGLHRFDWICINSEGNKFIVEVSLMPIKVKGELMFYSTWRDITERKRQEEELIIVKEKAEKRERQFYKALEFSPIPIAVADNNGVLLFLNRQFIMTYGYTIQEIKSIQNWFNIAYPEIEYQNFVLNDWTKTVEEAVKGNVPTSVREYDVTCKNGEIKTVAISAFFDEEYSIGIFNDVTEKKKIEKEMYNQLAEKEILLREVHHRVKNNILHIESFLSLQIESHSNPDVKTILQCAVLRVQSMRVLYDNLLLSKDYQDVSMKQYIENIIKSVKEIYSDIQKFNIEAKIADFSLPSKQATSLGIIINELLTNILKHAFRDIENGEVSVILEKTDAIITLIVHDNGKGFDEKILLNKQSGFGLKIIKMLSDQLKGTFSMSQDNGTKSTLQFKI